MASVLFTILEDFFLFCGHFLSWICSFCYFICIFFMLFQNSTWILVYFCCCDKTPRPKATWRWKVYYIFQDSINHWGKPGQESGIRNWSLDCGGTLLSGLLSLACLGWFLIPIRDYIPKCGNALSWINSSVSIINLKNAIQICPQTNQMNAIPKLRFLSGQL